MEKWKQPPLIKLYEALGAIADNRITINKNSAVVVSSSGKKQYTVIYDSKQNAITANDNGSYWQGYLGYPSIAFLIVQNILQCDTSVAAPLKGIVWKDINEKMNNDYEKTEKYVREYVQHNRGSLPKLDEALSQLEHQITTLNLNILPSKEKPLKER